MGQADDDARTAARVRLAIAGDALRGLDANHDGGTLGGAANAHRDRFSRRQTV